MGRGKEEEEEEEEGDTQGGGQHTDGRLDGKRGRCGLVGAGGTRDSWAAAAGFILYISNILVQVVRQASIGPGLWSRRNFKRSILGTKGGNQLRDDGRKRGYDGDADALQIPVPWRGSHCSCGLAACSELLFRDLGQWRW